MITFGEEYTFYTLRELVDVLNKFPDLRVRLINTDYTLNEYVESWRGSYNIPSIEPVCTKSMPHLDLSAGEIAKGLSKCFGGSMTGYKGGEYPIYDTDEFYISRYSFMDEYKITGFEIKDDFIILITELDRY